VIPASSILLNVPDPLSINTLELSESITSPGGPLLKEGTPVPEPNMINSANSYTLEKKFTLLLHKDSVELTGDYHKKRFDESDRKI